MQAMEFGVNTLSVYEFDRSAAKFVGKVSSEAATLAPKALEICREWIWDLWKRSVDHRHTVNLCFLKSALGTGVPTQTALRDVAEGVQVDRAAETLANAMEESGWSDHYALVVIGFSYGPVNFAAMIMTRSAAQQTYAVQPHEILEELQNVYDRKAVKAVMYPYFVSAENQVFLDQAKVYQANVAEFLPKCMKLELKPTPEMAVEEALPMAYATSDLNAIASHGLQEFATTLLSTAKDMHPDIAVEEAPLVLDIEGIEISAALAELTGGVLDLVDLGGGIWRVSLTGTGLRAKVGRTVVNLQYLVRREGVENVPGL